MTRKIFKFLKISVITLVIIVIFCVTAVSLLFYFYPEDSARNMIKSGAEKMLRRPVDIGSLKYSIRGVVLTDVVIYDTLPDGQKAGMVYSQEVVIRFSFLSILKKDVRIDTLRFKKLKILWEFDNKENSNLGRLMNDLKGGDKPPAEEVKPETKENKGGDDGKKFRISTVILEECTLYLVNPPAFYRPLAGEYGIDCTIDIEDGGKYIVSDTKLTLPEKRGTVYPELEVTTQDGIKITGSAKLEDADIPWTYGFARNKPPLPFIKVNGTVDSLEITKQQVKGHGKVTSTLKSSTKKLDVDGWCTVDVQTRIVNITDVKARLNESSVDLNSMTISAREGRVKKFSATNINITFPDAHSFSPVISPGLSGRGKGNLSYNGTTFDGRIELSNTSYRRDVEIVSDINTVVDINSGNIKKEGIPCKIFGNSCSISVATTDNSFTSFYLIVKSDRFETGNIKFISDDEERRDDKGKGRDSGGGRDVKVRVAGKVLVRELVHDDVKFRELNSDFVATKDGIKILSFSSILYSGKISGSGKVDTNGTPDVQLQLKYNNIKVQEIAFKNENMKDRFFGFAEGTAVLNFKIKKNLLSTITGNMTFTITKGKVVNTGVQNGLAIFLAELRYKLKDLEFQKIYGNIDINSNTYTVNSFIFNAEDVRLLLNGVIDSDLVAKNMSMKLEFNNHFIRDIPRPAVTVLGEYASGNWYIIPFEINGNITDSRNIRMLKKEQ